MCCLELLEASSEKKSFTSLEEELGHTLRK